MNIVKDETKVHSAMVATLKPGTAVKFDRDYWIISTIDTNPALVNSNMVLVNLYNGESKQIDGQTMVEVMDAVVKITPTTYVEDYKKRDEEGDL